MYIHSYVYAVGYKDYVCDIITYICTMFQCKLNYKYCAGIKNDYNV